MGARGLQKGPSACSSFEILLYASARLTVGGRDCGSADYLGMTLTHDGLPMAGIQDIDQHMQRRRSWNRGFNSAAPKEYEPLMAGRVAELARSLLTLQDKVIYLDDHFAQVS